MKLPSVKSLIRPFRNIRTWGVKWGLPIALAVGSGSYGFKDCAYDPYLRAGSESHLIQPPEGDRIYNGIWINHCANSPHILCFENKFGEKIDIVLRFINFKELQTDRPFPVKEAEYMRERGGVLSLTLEPWKGKGSPSLLIDIIRGKYDEELEAFAQGAAEYDGPVFVAFAPGMNSGPEPWVGQPEDYAKAYQHIHEIVAKRAKNITWVWNPNLGENLAAYYPGDFIHWIGINFFHPTGGSTDEIIQRMDAAITELKKHEKPLMIGKFGSRGKEKAEFLQKIVAKFSDWDIKAFIYFNYFRTNESNGLFENFMISQEETQKAYRDALSRLNLKGNIVTAEGELETELEEETPNKCELIEKYYWNAGEQRHMEELQRFIKNREYSIENNTDPHENNNLHVQLAEAFRQLARLIPFKKQKRAYIQKAFEHLELALNNPDTSIQYHPHIPYIREYFEIVLNTADLNLEEERDKKTYAWLDKVDVGASNPWVHIAQNVSIDSIPGYVHRGMLIRAQALERSGDLYEARKLYEAVDKWATEEQGKTQIEKWWSDEKTVELRFIAVKARLGMIRIDLDPAKPLTKEKVENILIIANSIFLWPELGIEEEGKGFMDNSFETFIYIMEACMRYSGGDLELAKKIFEENIRWKILETDDYKDLKKALSIKEKFTDDKLDRWKMVLEGLLMPDIKIESDALKARLSRLREGSRL